ncbi:DNA polymerase domain-containing protein [Paracoccus yeei]|uniref:DNA polymerase domain-containing protein n=1 Tax=Paracoccus yeei TaxID=147645 RepID=UPI00174A89CB|nr:DNA polymerase domain-containing protein [Paracoccus yeei]
MRTLGVDIETYHDFFFVGFKDFDSGQRLGVEMSTRSPDYDRERVRRILLKCQTVGYNSLTYDLPMIWYSLDPSVTNAMLKKASDSIIRGNLKYWEVEDFLEIRLPWELKDRHIDLIEPQPNAFASLKSLNGRMHGKQLQDLPFDPDARLTFDQMEVVADYCLHSDLDATHNLWNTLQEPMALRRALSEEHGQNFMSKSDSQIGEAIVKKRVEALTGRRLERVETKPGTTFRYPIPEWMRFETPQLQDILQRLRETDFMVKPDGKVDLPKWLSEAKITLGSSTYQMGIGGLHSTEANRAVFSDDDSVLVDADVASQYPSIILMLGLYPKALGEHFLTAYRSILNERLAAKARAKQIKDELPGVNDPDRIAALERELEQCQVKDKSGKISLNGVYGKLGSRYSVLYAPHLLISVTLTGQLTLLMLIEMALKAGIDVVSGNTDGVVFRCPRRLYAGLNKDRLHPSALEAVCSEWERITSFKLEFAEYRAIYNSSVNTYYAIKANGGHKRKGPVGNPWNKSKDDFDPVRGQLMKNPQMTICSDAALAKIKDGTPVDETIRACRDVTQFVTVIKASKGATWRGDYLGKTVRYYWGQNGEPIHEFEANEKGNFKKVPKTDGAIECMRLPDEFPSNIDYDRYVEEAETILRDVGFYGPIIPKAKPIRLTRKNKKTVLSLWAVAP